MIKTFTEYLKNKFRDEDDDGILDEPIHFKDRKNSSEDDGDGTLDEPIHFKDESNGKNKLQEAKKVVEKKPVTPKKHFNSWRVKNDNKHIHKAGWSDVISDKLHADNPRDLPRDQFRAVASYTGAGYHSLNKSLIKNLGKPKLKKHKLLVKHLDAAIRSNRIKRPLTVYSGVRRDPRLSLGKNGILKSHAYMSATHDKEVANEFSRHKATVDRNTGRQVRHIIQISLKPGNHAMHVEQHSQNQGEHETVLKRGTRLKHEKTKSYIDEYDDHIHVHHMSVVR